MWASRWGSSFDDKTAGVAIDSAGNADAVGTYATAIGTLSSTYGLEDIFVTSLQP